MCLILFAINAHPEYKFVLAANRDEFFSRETAFADNWPEDNNILAGKDRVSDGTWLGIRNSGRFVAITNYRDPKLENKNARSRGLISRSFLLSQEDIITFSCRLASNRDKYNGFNLLLTEDSFDSIYHYSNISNQNTILTDGIHGLSNALLDTPWPKVELGKEKLRAVLKEPFIEPMQLISILKDRSMADDQLLPETGIPADLEKKLSPVFISMKGYGTRCSTAVLVNRKNEVDFLEISYDEHMQVIHEARHHMRLKY